jgi:putative membrane protein
MKKTFIPFVIVSFTYALSACNSNDTSTSTSSSDSITTTSNMDTSLSGSKKDSMNVNNSGTSMIDENAMDFINKAATGGIMEVELGKMAQQKASDKKVKDFGKMMVDDHTRVNDNLKAIATKKSIDLPTSVTDDQVKGINELSKKSGKDFDKAYVDIMIQDHKDDIKEFAEANKKVADNDLKNFISGTLPILQKHLDSILAIKSKM